MNNSQMKAGRILKIQTGKRKMKFITDALENGRTVYIESHTHVWKLSRKHLDAVKMGKSGSVYFRRGKNWDCVDFCGLSAQ